MQGILLTWLLLAPIVGKNPVAQDTIAPINIQVYAGVRPAGDILRTGPEFGAKFEYRVIHPIILRLSTDYNFATVDNYRYPYGTKSSVDIAFEGLIYHGQKRLTAYFGGGVVYSINRFHLKRQVYDSLFSLGSIVNTNIENKYGYRIIFGLRFREHYAFEFGYQQSKPDFTFSGPKTGDQYIVFVRPGSVSTVRASVGYLFTL